MMKYEKMFGLATVVLVGCNNAGVPDDANKPVTTGTDVAWRSNSATSSDATDNSAKSTSDETGKPNDGDMTKTIRQRIVEAKLSSNAHSSQIVTKDGKVTVRGLVDTVEEKNRIEQIAAEIAGEGNVANYLEVQ